MPQNKTPSLESKPEVTTLSPGLYIVATPIGNLGDMTARARDILSRADLVACEDTRITGRLLLLLGLQAKLIPYHEHNAAEQRPKLLAALAAGQAVALVSDAGTPLISDPGYKLVREVADAGFQVYPVPGASALLAALCVSGLPTDRFMFAGFLPAKSQARQTVLADLKTIPASLVFFESAQRLSESLKDMAHILGPRDAAVARELTKFHEETRRGSLNTLAQSYVEMDPPKGELVIVVGPPDPDTAQVGDHEIDEMLHRALQQASLREAVDAVTQATGRKRKDIYAHALTLKAKN